MIGICIKYFHENYGGMLQAYATVSMLENCEIPYELIQYEKKRTLVEIVKRIFSHLIYVLLLHTTKKIIAVLVNTKIILIEFDAGCREI